jgi:ABC-type transporter lipoprotein component MlaA
VEPVNRTVAAVNFALLRYFLDPLSTGYRFLVPQPVRQSVSHFSENLVYPRRFLANLLQGKGSAAWEETQRFGVNTTIGVAGFFDPATRWGIPKHDEDFGQTFAAWGWRPSTFVSLPFFGPSTVRDTVGLVPDSLTNPLSWLLPFGPALGVNSGLALNEQSDLVPSYLRFSETNFDPYELSQMLWVINREKYIEDYRPTPEDTAAVQTLQAAFLSYHDPQFPERLRTGYVISASQQSLPYSYRMQPQPAPMVFLVPGLGAHRLDNSSLALAELAWEHGFSVALVSNPMNFEFIQQGLRAAVPGHVPVDSRDLHVALHAVNADLQRRFPEQMTARVLMGTSLGGFHALFLAAAERNPTNQLVTFDRYVILDTPVRLWTGMRALDRFYAAPLVFPAQEREARIQGILKRAMEFGREQFAEREHFSRMASADVSYGDWRPPGELPFSNLEAEYLIGLSFRLSLQAILWVSQEREDMGVLQTKRTWFRRWAAYQEMFDYGYEEYFYAFVFPYYRDRLHYLSTADEMIAANDLRTLTPWLDGQAKVRVFINEDDFLRTDEDEAWLQHTFGRDRVTIFPTGGHLGGLNKPEVQQQIMESLADLQAQGRP